MNADKNNILNYDKTFSVFCYNVCVLHFVTVTDPNDGMMGFCVYDQRPGWISSEYRQV